MDSASSSSITNQTFDAPETPSTASSHPSVEKQRRSYPAIVHFAVISSVLLPLAFLPYIITRRQLVTLRQSLSALETSNRLLRQDLTVSVAESTRIREDVKRMRGLLHELMEETEGLRTELKSGKETQKTVEDATQNHLQRLLKDNWAQSRQSLRSLGSSLADIAAFIHEMDLRMPFISKKNDKSRIERMRMVALKLQNLPIVEQNGSPAPNKENEERKAQ